MVKLSHLFQSSHELVALQAAFQVFRLSFSDPYPALK